jgi:hypothetical protein
MKYFSWTLRWIYLPSTSRLLHASNWQMPYRRLKLLQLYHSQHAMFLICRNIFLSKRTNKAILNNGRINMCFYVYYTEKTTNLDPLNADSYSEDSNLLTKLQTGNAMKLQQSSLGAITFFKWSPQMKMLQQGTFQFQSRSASKKCGPWVILEPSSFVLRPAT